MKKPIYSPEAQTALLADLRAKYGDVVTSKQISEFCRGMPYPYFLTTEKYRIGHGKYRLSPNADDAPAESNLTVAAAVAIELNPVPVISGRENLIPDRDAHYVPFGFFESLEQIILSKIFYPVYITGLSGNGKTYMVDQVCAKAKRELIRVNITKETDENDLIGSYELIEGNTVWRDGPVLIAMRRGAILLLDETDYGSERLLCLQPILEGKGYFNKKKGEYIEPAIGFNIMATANTKGKGSDDGRFIGANVLNEAFLERFAITVEQDYPNEKTERNILEKLFNHLHNLEISAGRPGVTPGMEVAKFSANLSKWAELIRKSHSEGAVEEIISTRRLGHIVKAYMIFRNKRKAIELCLNRFDTDVKKVYLDFYSKIDQNLDAKVVDVTFTVAPTPIAAAAPAAAPVQQTQAAAIAKAVKSAPVQANTNPTVPSGSSLIVFGDARNIANVGIKYKTKVAVTFDKSSGTATVTSHGMSSQVPATEYFNAKTDVLDKYVAMHAAKMASAADVTTQDDDVPF